MRANSNAGKCQPTQRVDVALNMPDYSGDRLERFRQQRAIRKAAIDAVDTGRHA